MNFFETFAECSLVSTVLKNTIKMIGHYSRLRDVTGLSYLICACTHANHARYSSVQGVVFPLPKRNRSFPVSPKFPVIECRE